MVTMPDSGRCVTGGVDTHRDVHVAAVLDRRGEVLATGSFTADTSGYAAVCEWVSSFGSIDAVGIEGTGSYGAGLCRWLQERGVKTVEVVRPNRQHRRRYGKSDETDAIAAARAVQSGEATAVPKTGNDSVESLRMLRIAHRSTVKARTATANQIHAVVVTAPDAVRDRLRSLTIPNIVEETQSHAVNADTETDVDVMAWTVLGSLTRTWTALNNEANQLTKTIRQIVAEAAPAAMMAEIGVGPITATDLLICVGDNPERLPSEASFAAVCGVSPVDCSSGTHQRHRLNRGGDRQANAALHRIVIVRLRYHQPTRDYMQRRLTEGKTRKETIRCLKRYLARTIYKHLQPDT